jgi:ATP-dependent Lon protease
MLPKRNQKDLEDVPAAAREKLEFVWLETVEDAMRCAIGGDPTQLFKSKDEGDNTPGGLVAA